MVCKNCNTENTDDAKFCHKCGSKLEADATTVSEPVTETPATETPTTTVEQQNVNIPVTNNAASKVSAFAILSLVVSLFGLIIFAIVCGIVGLCFALIAMKETNTNPQVKGRGLAIAGLVISIIDIVTFFLYMLI